MGIIRARNVILVTLILLGLSGCAAKRMQVDFVGFEKVYAETSNREQLLNLARLQNHDPTYFFKLGTIQSAYRMQASLTGTGQKVIQGNLGAAVTGSGTPTLLYENDPTFTYIPVNDETNAQLLLKPVPEETLYNLYLQGWRVDQLFRLMVDRIEVTTPALGKKPCTITPYRNVPPPVSSDPGYIADAGNYSEFLRISALLYALQKTGHLLLQGSTTFVAHDTKSRLRVGARGGTGASGAKGASGATGESAAAGSSDTPKAADIAAAAAKNESWEFDEEKGQWLLGQQIFSARFYLNPERAQPWVPGTELDANLQIIREDVLRDGRIKELKEPGSEGQQTLDNVLNILSGGFSIEQAPSTDKPGNGFCSSTAQGPGVSAHLVMRSLIGLMAAAAQEELQFESLKKLLVFKTVPLIEQIPTLRLQRKAGDKYQDTLVELTYARKPYAITDLLIPDSSPENQYWNRDMFRLINQLTAQVTVDISKFPLPGIVQIRTQ